MVSVAVEFGAAGGSTWTALTCDVFGLGWTRGATEDRGVLSIPESSQLVAYLVDPNRDLDPANAGGAFAGAIDVGARFRVTLGGVVAFAGIVDSIAHDLEPAKSPGAPYPYPLARIAVVDDIARAAGTKALPAGTASFPQETSSARFARLLDGAGLATGGGMRDIEAGGVTLQAATGLASDVWSDMVAYAQTELGSIEFRPSGQFVSRTRSTAWTPSAAVLHLGCNDPDSTAELALDALSIVSQRSTVRNRVSASRHFSGSGGPGPVTEENASSIAKYGLRAMSQQDLPLTDNAAVDAWALFVLNRTKVPTRELRDATVSARTDAAVQAIEAVPLFRGRVHVRQDHYGTPIDATLRLLGVAWDVDEAANATAQLVLGTDTALIPTLRRLELDAYDDWSQWLAGTVEAFGYSGSVGWTVDNASGLYPGALRTHVVGELAPSAGGVDELVITWSADL